MLLNIINNYRTINSPILSAYYALFCGLIFISLPLLISFGPSPWLPFIFFGLLFSTLYFLASPFMFLPFIIIARAIVEGGREANLPWMNLAPSILGIIVIGCAVIIVIRNLKTFTNTDFKILGLFVSMSLLGLFTSSDISSIQGFGRIASWLGVYAISALLVRKKYHLKIFVVSLTIAGTLASLFFVYSFITGKLVMSHVHYGVSGLFSFSSRNMLTVYLASIIPMIFVGRTLFAKQSTRTFLVAATIWFCTVVTLTHSRVGILLLALIAILWFWFLSKKVVAWLAGAMVVIYYFAPTVILRFKDIGFGGHTIGNTIMERFEFWRYGVSLIRAKPFFGHGLSNPFPFHNSYIQVAVELGLVGALLFIFIFLYFIYKSFMTFRNTREIALSNLTGGCLISQIVIMVAMFTENSYSGTALMWVFWILAGIVWAIANFRKEPFLIDRDHQIEIKR